MRRRRSFSMAAVRSAPTRPSLSSASGRGMRTRLVLRHLDRGNQRGDYRGNEPDMRLARLRQFWKQSTSSFRWPALDFGDDMRRLFNYTSSISSLLSGQPGFFQPRFIPPFLQPHGTSGALSVYDTSPLRTTLEALVDFDRINSGKTRLSLGAVNIRLGNFVYFEPPALTASAMRSKPRKQFSMDFVQARFHTAWTHSGTRQGRIASFIPSVSDREGLTGWQQPVTTPG